MIEAKHTGVSQSLGKLKAERDKIIKALSSLTHVQVNREYSHVFSGMSLNLREDKIPALLAIPGVKAVYPNVEYRSAGNDLHSSLYWGRAGVE